MEHFRPGAVDVVEYEGRAANQRRVDAHAGGDPPNQHRLAGAELTAQQDEVAGLDPGADALAERERFRLGRASRGRTHVHHEKCREPIWGRAAAAPPS